MIPPKKQICLTIPFLRTWKKWLWFLRTKLTFNAHLPVFLHYMKNVTRMKIKTNQGTLFFTYMCRIENVRILFMHVFFLFYLLMVIMVRMLTVRVFIAWTYIYNSAAKYNIHEKRCLSICLGFALTVVSISFCVRWLLHAAFHHQQETVWTLVTGSPAMLNICSYENP